MYARIVVALDGSSFAEEVIPRAARIAEQIGATLSFVRVAERPGDMLVADEYVRTLARRHGVDGRAVVASGSVSESIMGEVDRVPDSLVAISARGRSGLGTAVLGSTAREYVQSSHDPVLVYRPTGVDEHDVAPVTTVLLPLDGTERSESMANEAADWAQALHANLVIVQAIDARGVDLSGIDTTEDAYVHSRADVIAERVGIPVAWEVLHGDPAQALAAYVRGRRDVLIVMATRTQPALRAAVLGSVTSELMHGASVPVVVRAVRS